MVSKPIHLTIGLEKSTSDSAPVQLNIGTPVSTPVVVATVPTQRIVSNTISDKTSNTIENNPQYYSLLYRHR